MSQPPYIRPEFEGELPPLRNLPVETPLPLSQRLWNQAWLRKSVIVALVLALWEIAARIQQNDLMLPGVFQTLQAAERISGRQRAGADCQRPGSDHAVWSRSAQHINRDAQSTAGNCAAAAGSAVVWSGKCQPDICTDTFRHVAHRSEYLVRI